MNKAIHYSQAVRLGSDVQLIVLLYVIYEILKRHEKKFLKEVTLPGKWRPKSSYNSTDFLSREVEISLEISVSKNHCISEIPYEARENRFHLHSSKHLWLVKTTTSYIRIASELKEAREGRWSKEIFWGLPSPAVGKSLMLWAEAGKNPAEK